MNLRSGEVIVYILDFTLVKIIELERYNEIIILFNLSKKNSSPWQTSGKNYKVILVD